MMKIYAPDGFKTFGVFCCLRRFSGRIFFIGRIHMIPPYDELTGQYEEEDRYEVFFRCLPTTCRRTNVRGRYIMISGGKKMRENRLLSTRNIAVMGMLGALSAVLMLFEVPLPFIAPSFYGLDLSEVPILVGTFALGPLAGAVMEVVKILIKLVLKPTSTGFVGEFANLVFGCSMVLPAGLIYRFHKTKKGAMFAMAAGTVIMAVVGVAGNALVMLPFYSNFMPLESILAAGAAINPAVGNVWTFAIFCVGPFNIVKGILVSLITALVYKRVSVMIRSIGTEGGRSKRSVQA